MRTFFITFRSVTHAQRGERLLRQAGIRCTLQRTPRWMEEQGCGYCLRLRETDMGTVLAMLQRQQLPLRRVYVQGEDGILEAVEL